MLENISVCFKADMNIINKVIGESVTSNRFIRNRVTECSVISWRESWHGERSEFMQTDVLSSHKQKLCNSISLYLHNIKSVAFLASSYIMSTKPGSRN